MFDEVGQKCGKNGRALEISKYFNISVFISRNDSRIAG